MSAASVLGTAAALCTIFKVLFANFDLTVWAILLSPKICKKHFKNSTYDALATIQLSFLG
jgi:hypothetical protein